MSRIPLSSRATCALLLLSLLSGPAWTDPSSDLLSLPAARRIALDRQPLLEAEAHQVDAARESAVAARQLPDPVLIGGVSNLTATGDDIGTLTRQTDTQFTVGLSQAFPRAAKRRLRGERADAETLLAERRLLTDRLQLERDVGLAWLDVWKAHEALTLARRSEREAQLQVDSLQLAYASGRRSQAELREARVALELLRDELARLEQDDWHARSQLSRWLGDAAYRPLPDGPPPLPEPPPLGALLEGLKTHPHLDITSAEIAVAAADVRLAQQAYQSDFSVELGYGHRPAFSDYVNLQVSVDLPVFTADRQDRGLAAKQSALLRAEALREDSYREHAADARLNHGDWTRLGSRLAHFDDSILPEADARIEAARLAWAAGSGSLSEVLAARRAALDARLRRLDLETDRSRHALQLRYLAAREPDADTESAGVTP